MTIPAEDEHVRNSTLLMLLKQQGHEGQRQLMFTGETSSLTRHNRLIGVRTPSAPAFHAHQQRRVCFKWLSGGANTLQPQTDHAITALNA